MKRSEMISLIQAFYANIDVPCTPRKAKDLLDLVENAGMLPPCIYCSNEEKPYMWCDYGEPHNMRWEEDDE